jgi:polyisoprenoid-binding protein YceI
MPLSRDWSIPSVTKYFIDPERSQVWIDARSSLHPINSSTTGLDGWLDMEVGDDGRIDVAAAPQGHLELPVELLSSGNPLYDREMQRRIDSRRYPTIKGDLETLEHLDSNGRYKVRGDLTFHGVTRTFEHEMLITPGDDRTLQLEGENVFDVRDFNVTPPKMLMLKVYPEVSVRVSIVARQEATQGD